MRFKTKYNWTIHLFRTESEEDAHISLLSEIGVVYSTQSLNVTLKFLQLWEYSEFFLGQDFTF